MTREKLTTHPEQSTPEELKQFMDMAYAQTDMGLTQLESFISGVHTTRRTSVNTYNEFAMRQSAAVDDIYATFYPTDDMHELRAIARYDAAVLCTIWTIAEYGRFNPDETYDSDRQEFTQGVFGQTLNSVKIPYNHRELADMPVLKARIEQGMPRGVQLFMAAYAMSNLNARHDYRKVHAEALYYLPELWNLSDEEIRAVTQACANSQYGSNILSLAVADERTLVRYANLEGSMDVEVLGGYDALDTLAQESFLEFIEANGRGDQAYAWVDLSRAIPELIDRFPMQARKDIAEQTWLRRPFVPNDAVKAYLSPRTTAELSYKYVGEQVELSDTASKKKHTAWTVYDSARSLDCPSDVAAACIYKSYEMQFQLMQAGALMNDKVLHNFAKAHKDAYEQVDPELMDLMSKYTDIIASGALYWPVDGWDGTEESKEVSESMSTEHSKAMNALRTLREQIQQKFP